MAAYDREGFGAEAQPWEQSGAQIEYTESPYGDEVLNAQWTEVPQLTADCGGQQLSAQDGFNEQEYMARLYAAQE